MAFASVWKPREGAASWHAAVPRAASGFRLETRPARMAQPRVKRGVGATLTTLKRRPEFLRVRAGARWATPTFVLEAKQRTDVAQVENVPRFGFTVSKQIGGAV